MSVATALRTLFTLSLAWSLAIESVRGKLSNGLGSVLIYLWSLWSYCSTELPIPYSISFVESCTGPRYISESTVLVTLYAAVEPFLSKPTPTEMSPQARLGSGEHSLNHSASLCVVVR